MSSLRDRIRFARSLFGGTYRDWTPHPRGGGLVQAGASVSASAFLGSEAIVAQQAVVQGNVLMNDQARVCGSARVGGEARLYGRAVVGGQARVSDQTCLMGGAHVTGRAGVWGMATIHDAGRVEGAATVGGSAVVRGSAVVCGTVIMTSGHLESGTWALAPFYVAFDEVMACEAGPSMLRIGNTTTTLDSWRRIATTDETLSPGVIAVLDMYEAVLATRMAALDGTRDHGHDRPAFGRRLILDRANKEGP